MNVQKGSHHPGLAVVTGGSGGIGAACCRRLSRAGFRVGIGYNRHADSAEALAQELPDAFPVQADLADEAAIDRIYARCKSDDLPLAVLVNNAGMTIDAPLFQAKLDHFDKVVGVNMRGAWYLTKRLSRLMMRQKSGRILFISSVVGHVGNPGQSVYGMTKAAIENLTRTLAVELAPWGILVNAVAPGFIDTAMTTALPEEIQGQILRRIPLGRVGTVDEVAEVVAFLASSGSYVTGTTIHVNGGMYGG